MKQFLIGLIIVVLVLVLVEVVALLRLRAQLTSHSQYWTAQAALPIEPNALTYVALGDSAAQGIGASHPTKGYVGLIADGLARKTGRPVHVINLSVSGAKVADAINKQLPELNKLDLPADAVITIEIGANNMLSYDSAQFKTEINTLFAALPPQTVVSDMPYFGGRAQGSNSNAFMASGIIAEAAQKHGLKKAELYKISKANNSIRSYAADLFHPSDRGYQNWYRAFWQQLD